MEANIINISNFDQYKLLIFKKCVFTRTNKSITHFNREKIREKFSRLKQKVGNKLRGEEKINNDNDMKSNFDKLKSYYRNKKENMNMNLGLNSLDISQTQSQSQSQSQSQDNKNETNTRGDYLERLRKFYKIKKEKAKYNLHNFQKFYKKRLDEKESTKLMKSITRWILLTSFAFLNLYLFRRNHRFRTGVFLFTTLIFLNFNIVIQSVINSRYKRRIRELGEESLYTKI